MEEFTQMKLELEKLKVQNLKLFYLHRKIIENPKLIKQIDEDFCFKIEKKDLQKNYNEWMENIKFD